MLHHPDTTSTCPPEPKAPTAGLSAKERAVVLGLARGRAPKQLAADCGVSLATIRCHIHHAKGKTRARTLPELVAITIRLDGSR